MNDTPRIAVVTGASRGIGAEIAKALAHQGRHVVLLARDSAKLETVRQQIDAASPGPDDPSGHDRGRASASVKTCDVSDQAALESTIETIAKEHDRLDILVNNAGITRDNLVLRMRDEEFDEVVTVNLRSVFVACRAVLRPMMRNKWGRIINVSSVAGLVGNAGQANYAASKSAVLGFTKSLAKEMASKNITANVVAPGFVETEMTDILPQQVKEAVLQATPVRRFGQPQDVASAAAFLASEEAGFITGQVLSVDGGMTMV